MPRVCVRELQIAVLCSESNYCETDTHVKRRKSGCLQAETIQKHTPCTFSPRKDSHADNAFVQLAHTDTHGRVLSDGQWPRAVVMLGDFSFFLHCQLLHLSFPLSVSHSAVHAAVNTMPVKFTFKCLYLVPWSILPFSPTIFLSPHPPACPWHTASRPHPNRLLSPNERWLPFQRQ